MSSKIIVCDTNVIIQCCIIDKNFFSYLKSKGYSFSFHRLVVDELKNMSKKSRLLIDCGKDFFSNIFDEISSLNEQFEYEGFESDIENLRTLEDSLTPDQRSSPATDIDLEILAYSLKYNLKIATQEKSLYNLALISHQQDSDVLTTLNLFSIFIEEKKMNKDEIIECFKKLTEKKENVTNLRSVFKKFSKKYLS